jgi:hypothetical protein
MVVLPSIKLIFKLLEPVLLVGAAENEELELELEP